MLDNDHFMSAVLIKTASFAIKTTSSQRHKELVSCVNKDRFMCDKDHFMSMSQRPFHVSKRQLVSCFNKDRFMRDKDHFMSVSQRQLHVSQRQLVSCVNNDRCTCGKDGFMRDKDCLSRSVTPWRGGEGSWGRGDVWRQVLEK